MSAILPHMEWPSANLRCRSETSCTRLDENTGRKKSRQKSPSGHQRTNLLGYIFVTNVRINNRKKSLFSSNISSTMSSQYGELRPTSGRDRFTSLGDPCQFQRVSRHGSITARHASSRRQPNFAVLNRGRHLYSAGAAAA